MTETKLIQQIQERNKTDSPNEEEETSEEDERPEGEKTSDKPIQPTSQ